MSIQTRKALADIDLFADLPKEVLDDLNQQGTTLTTSPGHQVISQGADDLGLRIVLEGSAEVTVNGQARPALGPGDYFGEISMIDGAPRSATVVAGPDGLKTFAVSSLAFAPMLDRADVGRALLKALCARIRALEAAGQG